MPLPNPPAEECEATDGKPLPFGYEFQVKIQVTGSCAIRRLRVRAEIQEEQEDGDCPESDETETALIGCNESAFSYDSHEA
jgi:hypothetical protein